MVASPPALICSDICLKVHRSAFFLARSSARPTDARGTLRRLGLGTRRDRTARRYVHRESGGGRGSPTRRAAIRSLLCVGRRIRRPCRGLRPCTRPAAAGAALPLCGASSAGSGAAVAIAGRQASVSPQAPLARRNHPRDLRAPGTNRTARSTCTSAQIQYYEVLRNFCSCGKPQAPGDSGGRSLKPAAVSGLPFRGRGSGNRFWKDNEKARLPTKKLRVGYAHGACAGIGRSLVRAVARG